LAVAITAHTPGQVAITILIEWATSAPRLIGLAVDLFVFISNPVFRSAWSAGHNLIGAGVDLVLVVGAAYLAAAKQWPTVDGIELRGAVGAVGVGGEPLGKVRRHATWLEAAALGDVRLRVVFLSPWCAPAWTASPAPSNVTVRPFGVPSRCWQSTAAHRTAVPAVVTEVPDPPLGIGELTLRVGLWRVTRSPIRREVLAE
jgi:hypothetical protein